MRELQALIERYFPCSFERGGPLLVVLGVLSTLFFVFTQMGFHEEFRDQPEHLMVLTFLISAWSQRHRLKSDLVMRLLILAGVIPWLLFAVNALIDYETAVKYRSANELLNLFLFLPLAWWMGGSAEGARRMLIIAFLGLITAIVFDPDLEASLRRMFAGQRIDFDIQNAQHGAMFFGLVVLYCICALSHRKPTEALLSWRNALILLTGLAGLAGVAGTQTRAAFIGLFACGLVALVRKVMTMKRLGTSTFTMIRNIVVLLLVAGVLSWASIEILQKRGTADLTIAELLITGNLEEIPIKGSGIRVHSWVEALKWIAARPITGWGPEARRDVIPMAEHFPDDIRTSFGHLHNGYLSILLGFGAVGFIFIVICSIAVYKRIRLAASPDLYAFAFYGGIFFLVLNLFESFTKYWSGHLALALILAGGYSQYLASKAHRE